MITNIKLPLTVQQFESVVKSRFPNGSDADLLFSTYTHKDKKISVVGIVQLIDSNKLESSLLVPLLESKKIWTAQSIIDELPLNNGSKETSLSVLFQQLVTGTIIVYIENEKEFVTYSFLKEEQRSLDKSETESVVIGPQLSFTESLPTNLNVIRQLLPTPDLVIEKQIVGKKVPREVRMIYLQSMANDEDVQTMRQRIQDLEVDEIEDSTVLMHYLEDFSYSLFPQFYLTELPAHLSYTIKKGKIGVLVENSPNGFVAPSTFFSFYETTEDVYSRWLQGSALKFLRIISMIAAFLLTSLYVAIVTYHYELIPTALIVSIGQSRASVPFPPIIEALLIELMIELLREAGARLPTKIGQTMGIVGGIVIGQAAVQAGITSNILIIVVAITTLASFTTPNYSIGASFRIARFPIIILAGLFGLIGVMFGVCLLTIHLLRTTSLGRPYLAPVYPLRLEDFNHVLFQTPPSKNSKRAQMYRPKDLTLYSKEKANKKHDPKNR